ncbi:MAG: DNA polymerase III subunit beta [Bacteroidales bacterium]|jgi:DNA polymerase-3 subunit beta|nr:DNA polymerase III subunit beta [Paludibacteraceae bacterium]MDY6373602.1 DNA polymerase III subunit beta [Bacteroidales bacterium]MDY6426597.1 DNA polymerase III subunit beta [Bacteroidales bacterium]
MKFKVSSTLLCERLQTAAKFIPAKPALPIYGYFLFAVDGSKLTITASDADTTLVTSLDIENMAGNGRVALQSRILSEGLKDFRAQSLVFDIDDHNFNVQLSSENGKYNFMGQNAADYVEFAGLNADATSAFSISSSKLVDAISKTAYAVANDEIRPIMNGICFHFNDAEGLNVVATDGHRLSKVALDEHPGLNCGFVFPQKPANLLKGVLSKEVGDVQISFDNKFIVCQMSAYTMFTRQIEGNYPNYGAVIPASTPVVAIVNRETMLSALRRVQVCSDQGSNLIKITISNSQIKIMGQDIDFAVSGEEVIPCSYDGQEITIGFKSTLLVDILNNIDCVDVEIHLTDQSRPGVFIPVQQKEGMNVLMLAMPMMLA